MDYSGAGISNHSRPNHFLLYFAIFRPKQRGQTSRNYTHNLPHLISDFLARRRLYQILFRPFLFHIMCRFRFSDSCLLFEPRTSISVSAKHSSKPQLSEEHILRSLSLKASYSRKVWFKSLHTISFTLAFLATSLTESSFWDIVVQRSVLYHGLWNDQQSTFPRVNRRLGESSDRRYFLPNMR